MAIKYITYNPDTLPTGDRIVVLNGSDPPKFEQFEEIVKKTDIEGIEEIILDNQSRINNLENTEVKKIIGFLDKISIKKQFTEANMVEISHFRKEIISVKVMKVRNINPSIVEETNITAGTNIKEVIERNSEGKIVDKKVILDFGEAEITGYVIII